VYKFARLFVETPRTERKEMGNKRTLDLMTLRRRAVFKCIDATVTATSVVPCPVMGNEWRYCCHYEAIGQVMRVGAASAPMRCMLSEDCQLFACMQEHSEQHIVVLYSILQYVDDAEQCGSNINRRADPHLC
jgi:hypothetical protein